MQFEQSRALKQMSGEDAALPQKLKQLQQEVRGLKERNSNYQTLIRDKERREKIQQEHMVRLEE